MTLVNRKDTLNDFSEQEERRESFSWKEKTSCVILVIRKDIFTYSSEEKAFFAVALTSLDSTLKKLLHLWNEVTKKNQPSFLRSKAGTLKTELS